MNLSWTPNISYYVTFMVKYVWLFKVNVGMVAFSGILPYQQSLSYAMTTITTPDKKVWVQYWSRIRGV